MPTRALKALENYKAHPDPLAALANTVALVVAGNQPFYPLYLHAIVGRAAWPAWIFAPCSSTTVSPINRRASRSANESKAFI